MFTTPAKEFAALHESAVLKTLDKHFDKLVQEMDSKLELAKQDMLKGKVVSQVHLLVDIPGVSKVGKTGLAKRLVSTLHFEGFDARLDETPEYDDGPNRSSPAMVHVVVNFG